MSVTKEPKRPDGKAVTCRLSGAGGDGWGEREGTGTHTIDTCCVSESLHHFIGIVTQLMQRASNPEPTTLSTTDAQRPSCRGRGHENLSFASCISGFGGVLSLGASWSFMMTEVTVCCFVLFSKCCPFIICLSLWTLEPFLVIIRVHLVPGLSGE